MDIAEWTEGVCGDGAVILRDGQPVPIAALLDHLNAVEADTVFLALRCRLAGTFRPDRERDWGQSSNSLVAVAYGVGPLAMPSDWSDYAACVRVARRLPRHRLTPAIRDALRLQRREVERNHTAAERRNFARRKRAA